MNKHKQLGFTIVELLIVVVVIAILAAITIVSFNGIQQRSNNAAIVDAAGKSHRMIMAYIASTGEYPYTAGTSIICITTDTTCRRNGSPYSSNASFESAIATVGSLPRAVPMATNTRGGITYNYDPSRTVDGNSAPAVLSYYLLGVNTSCGLPVISSDSATAVTVTREYTSGNVGDSGATHCAVSIPGPRV